MSYTYEMPNMSGGFDNTLVELNNEVGVFVPFTLLFVFFLIFLGGITRQKAKSGYADVPLWSTLASMGTLLVTLAMSLADGLINNLTLAVVIVLTILSFIWLALGSTNREV